MNKKTAIVSVLLGVLLIGIVSAGLIEYYGRIEGSVTVEAPVLYLDGQLGEAYYNLFVNEIPSLEEEVHFNDGNRLLFMTEPLGVDNFYQANFDIKIWVKTNIEGNIMQFQVVRIKPDFSEEIICIPPSIEPNAGTSFTKRETSCSSTGEINLNPEDKIGLEIKGAGVDSEYWIITGHEYVQGASRIEVTAI